MKKNFTLLLAMLMLFSLLQVPCTALASEEAGSIIITPTAQNCLEFNGWTGASSLKRYDGVTTSPTGSGTALFEVPEHLDGWVTVYYWIPKYDTGYTQGIGCGASLILSDDVGNDVTLGVAVTSGNGGKWEKAGVIYVEDSTFETLNITKGSTTSRLTDVKFVPGGTPAYAITLDHFTTTGDWEDTTQIGAYQNRAFMAKKSNGKNAVVKASGLTPGEYYVHVHSVDYAYNTGNRKFSIIANGTEYKKTEELYFGSHLKGTDLDNSIENPDLAEPYFDWEQMGYPKKTVTVGEDGVLQLELSAKSTYARVDALVITTDPDFEVYSTVEGAVASAAEFPAVIPYQDKIIFPENAKGELSDVDAAAVLQNEHTTVSFKKGVSAKNRTVVQREVKVGDTVTVPFESGLGFLSLYAESTNSYQRSGYYGQFDTNYKLEDGVLVRKNTTNVFLSGIPEWLVPDTLEQVNENTVRMTADGEYASITAVWTLEESDKEPKVTVTLTAKKDGEYSLGLFQNVNEVPRSEVGYILNPYRWQESRYPDPGVTITETNSTTDHTQMTYKMNEKGQEISLGVAIDQSSIDLSFPLEGSEYETGRWVHDSVQTTGNRTWDEDLQPDGTYKPFVVDFSNETADFVMNTIGRKGGVQPAIFAPKMASLDSSFTAGETYTVSYRPLSTVSTLGENRGWYDCYKHVVQDLRGIYDYRDNYFSSMTDAVFNILNFLKDDEMSGWSDEMIGHYNIEDSHWISNSNGLVYLQNYLLTEDSDLLMNRTLPSMGSILTRDSHHLYRRFTIRDRSEGPINKELDVTAMGMGNTTYEGAYLMSMGQMPVYRSIAKKRLMLTGAEDAALGLRNITDVYWYERANGSTDFPQTKEHADKYFNMRSFISAKNYVDVETFLNISYTPQFQMQFDAYEITGDKKYLEGAIEGARRFLPTLRVTDMPDSKDVMYVENTEQFVAQDKNSRNRAWSYDDFRYRRGALMVPTGETTYANGAPYREYETKGYAEDAITVRDMTGPYPAWVTARAGLGVEQFSTCLEGRNIMMSTWAGDVLRLGYLSDDQLMMDLARSSLVGRFSNYPGYYYTEYTRLPGLENYPLEAFDITSLYFHHAPVFLAAVQDYLFSNAWVKSDGKVNFPNTRIQGYAWFNNRMYGHAPGVIYDETDMWPWLKEGTIEVSSKQIDWIAGRKNGRAAFVLTNAGDNVENITLTFNQDLGIKEGATVTVYDKAGNISTTTVSDGKISLSIPVKGILTVAVDGENIKVPLYTKVEFDETQTESLDNTALGLMYEGKTYSPSYSFTANGSFNYGYSQANGYDVKAYALALEPTSYMGYIFVGGRSTERYEFIGAETGLPSVGGGDGEGGIVKSTLKWHFEGEDEVNTVVDDVFPYEFWIPVENSRKSIVFTVETEFKDGVKSLGQEYTLSPKKVTLESDVNKKNFTPVSMGDVIKTMGGVSAPLTTGTAKFCLYNNEKAENAFSGFDFKADDALKNCYLNGYLKVKDISATADIQESGYILFDNVKIVQSRNNTDRSRVDFSIADPFTSVGNTNPDLWAVYDKNGKYLGVKQNMLNTGNQGDIYEWENLYITNTRNDNSIKLTQEGNTYTISCNGAKYVKVLTVTYSNGVMTDVQSENVIVSINNPKVITVNANQKVMVWDNVMYEGSTFAPILPVMTR